VKRKIGLRTIGSLLALLAAAGLAGLWWANTQTETAYVAAADIPRHEQVAAEDLLKVEIPRRRAKEIAVLQSPPVGQWAAIHVPANTLLGPAMFTDVPPDRRVLGETLLPLGWRGYVLVVQTPLTAELVPGDLVDLVLVEESGEEGLLLFQKVPLLEEVFASCGSRLYFDVELKWDLRAGNGLEEKVVALVRRHGLQERCLLSSFNPYCVLRARRLAPELPTAHIWSGSRELPFLLRHGAAAVLQPGAFAKPEGRRLRRWNAALFRLLGSRLLAWTVDDPAEARRLLGLGVRGLIANDPGRLLQAGLFPPR